MHQSTIQETMLAQCEEADRKQAAYLAAHPETSRYCYRCQLWLKNADAMPAHIGHVVR